MQRLGEQSSIRWRPNRAGSEGDHGPGEQEDKEKEVDQIIVHANGRKLSCSLTTHGQRAILETQGDTTACSTGLCSICLQRDCSSSCGIQKADCRLCVRSGMQRRAPEATHRSG